MLTEFQKKRLNYFIKAAEKQEWIQLGQADIEMFSSLKALALKQEKELEMELAQYQIKIDK